MKIPICPHFRRSLAEHEENLKQMDEESKTMEEALAKSGVEEQKRLERQKHKEQVALSEHYKKTVSISDPTPSETTPMKKSHNTLSTAHLGFSNGGGCVQHAAAIGAARNQPG